MNKLLNWWNNTKFVQKKYKQWYNKTHLNTNKNLKGVDFVKDNCYPNKSDIPESDWLFSVGDICERYVTWFFYTFTHKCVVKNRAIQYHEDYGSTSPFPGMFAITGYCAGYKVTDLDDNNNETDSREVFQSFLSK